MKKNLGNRKSSDGVYTTLDDWIANETIPFSVDSSETFNAAVDKFIASLADSVELLGFGEALHGGEDILILRNRFFQRLVETHGFSAIAIESSFPRGQVVNEYIAGRSQESYEAMQDTGFSHGFGKLDANRELIEWMRRYNADPSHIIKLQSNFCILCSIILPRWIVSSAKNTGNVSIRCLVKILIGRILRQ
jgi:erythromycin esterase